MIAGLGPGRGKGTMNYGFLKSQILSPGGEDTDIYEKPGRPMEMGWEWRFRGDGVGNDTG